MTNKKQKKKSIANISNRDICSYTRPPLSCMFQSSLLMVTRLYIPKIIAPALSNKVLGKLVYENTSKQKTAQLMEKQKQ